MPVPTFDKMLRPLLELSVAGDIRRRTAPEEMSQYFHLTDKERSERIPSGKSTVVGNRTGWAMTFLTKGNLIEKVAPKTYRATSFGKTFLSTHPSTIAVKDLRGLPEWEANWKTRKKAQAQSGHLTDEATENATPLESLENAIATLEGDLRSRLLEEILKQTPTFFEQLVLDVLLAMGYGGSREDAAERLGKSSDEGIDGRINQDTLGLDQIMVQAKRYASDNIIDRRTIQAFIGSLAGQGVTKGIFITTSRFAASAEEFVQRGSNTKVVLIDGDALLELMMRHKIGVRSERRIDLLNVDQNYFDEE